MPQLWQLKDYIEFKSAFWRPKFAIICVKSKPFTA